MHNHLDNVFFFDVSCAHIEVIGTAPDEQVHILLFPDSLITYMHIIMPTATSRPYSIILQAADC